MAGYYSALFSQLAFKFFQTWMADFTLFVGILRAMKTSHFVTIFSNPDGRLHFVRRHPGGMKIKQQPIGRFAPSCF